jgi:D-alanine-D-alanine ligase
MQKAILLFGGSSDERLVSAASAQNLSRQFQFDELWFMHFSDEISRVSLAELDVHQRPFELEFKPQQKPFAANLSQALPQIQGRVIFMGFHGTQGEDGQIQALFEKNKIPFTGAGAESSQNCFDKLKAKQIARRNGLPLAAETVLAVAEKSKWSEQLQAFFTTHGKMVVKPVASGSSFGLHFVSTVADLQTTAGLIQKENYGHYLVEVFLQGRELTVGVREDVSGDLRPLPPSEVVMKAGHSFDYQGKYLGRGSTEITPAELSSEQTAAAQQLALDAHRALGCRGYSRTDMILTAKGAVFLETNTLPGLSKASFIPQQLMAAGIPVGDFLNQQIPPYFHEFNSDINYESCFEDPVIRLI